MEADGVADELFWIEGSGLYFFEDLLVARGLHTVTAEDLEFFGDHRRHGDRRFGVLGQHQPHLDMSAPFS